MYRLAPLAVAAHRRDDAPTRKEPLHSSLAPKGIAKLPAGGGKSGLAAWLGRLRASYADRLLGVVDVEIAAIWGRMTARVESAGAHLAVLDGLAAATASRHGHTVVTRNVKDLFATSVPVHDPWRPA